MTTCKRYGTKSCHPNKKMPLAWLLAVLTKEVIKEIILVRMKSLVHNWWVTEKHNPAITYPEHDSTSLELNEVECLFNEHEEIPIHKGE